MGLIPQNRFAEDEFEFVIFPSKTYAMDLQNGRIRGFTDGQEAMRQAIYKVLSTERFLYGAYSDNYGVELYDLIGMPVSYVLPEIKRCITEALTWDSRIRSVDGFSFEIEGGKVHCTFVVHTIYGDIDAEKVVEPYV